MLIAAQINARKVEELLILIRVRDVLMEVVSFAWGFEAWKRTEVNEGNFWQSHGQRMCRKEFRSNSRRD